MAVSGVRSSWLSRERNSRCMRWERRSDAASALARSKRLALEGQAQRAGGVVEQVEGVVGQAGRVRPPRGHHRPPVGRVDRDGQHVGADRPGPVEARRRSAAPGSAAACWRAVACAERGRVERPGRQVGRLGRRRGAGRWRRRRGPGTGPAGPPPARPRPVSGRRGCRARRAGSRATRLRRVASARRRSRSMAAAAWLAYRRTSSSWSCCGPAHGVVEPGDGAEDPVGADDRAPTTSCAGRRGRRCGQGSTAGRSRVSSTTTRPAPGRGEAGWPAVRRRPGATRGLRRARPARPTAAVRRRWPGPSLVVDRAGGRTAGRCRAPRPWRTR